MFSRESLIGAAVRACLQQSESAARRLREAHGELLNAGYVYRSGEERVTKLGGMRRQILWSDLWREVQGPTGRCFHEEVIPASMVFEVVEKETHQEIGLLALTLSEVMDICKEIFFTDSWVGQIIGRSPSSERAYVCADRLAEYVDTLTRWDLLLSERTHSLVGLTPESKGKRQPVLLDVNRMGGGFGSTAILYAGLPKIMEPVWFGADRGITSVLGKVFGLLREGFDIQTWVASLFSYYDRWCWLNRDRSAVNLQRYPRLAIIINEGSGWYPEFEEVKQLLRGHQRGERVFLLTPEEVPKWIDQIDFAIRFVRAPEHGFYTRAEQEGIRLLFEAWQRGRVCCLPPPGDRLWEDHAWPFIIRSRRYRQAIVEGLARKHRKSCALELYERLCASLPPSMLFVDRGLLTEEGEVLQLILSSNFILRREDGSEVILGGKGLGKKSLGVIVPQDSAGARQVQVLCIMNREEIEQKLRWALTTHREGRVLKAYVEHGRMVVPRLTPSGAIESTNCLLKHEVYLSSQGSVSLAGGAQTCPRIVGYCAMNFAGPPKVHGGAGTETMVVYLLG